MRKFVFYFDRIQHCSVTIDAQSFSGACNKYEDLEKNGKLVEPLIEIHSENIEQYGEQEWINGKLSEVIKE